MARKKVNVEEKLDDNSMERVIKYLSEKGSTKKIACQMLNISYNTTRLDKLIQTYLERKEYNAKRRAEKRGKPATEEEIKYVISEYLEGIPVDTISKSLFRGTTFIKSILDQYNVPERDTSTDYFHPKLIPDEAVRDRFTIGEKVWSARYNTIVEVLKELHQNNQYVYQIYLIKDLQYGYQPACELASLESLRNMGINL